jgi:hypothetical protein
MQAVQKRVPSFSFKGNTDFNKYNLEKMAIGCAYKSHTKLCLEIPAYKYYLNTMEILNHIKQKRAFNCSSQ